MPALARYREVFREIQKRLWVQVVLLVWAVIATYDTFLSQFVPEEYSAQLPKAWQVTAMTGELLPWWGWLLILAAILVAASLEYAARSGERAAALANAPRGDTALATGTVTDNPNQRISLLEFFRRASQQAYDFKGSSHAILHMCSRLRQAGADGEVQFWGRARHQNDPLLPIPKEHWYEYQIDWTAAFSFSPPAGEITGFSNDNYFVITRNSIKSDRKAYFDLHVTLGQAMKMLGSH